MMNGGDDRHFDIAPACNIDMRGLSRGGMSSLRRDEQRCGQDCSVLQRYAYLILIQFEMGGARGDMEMGSAHVCSPVTNPHIVCRLLLDIKNTALLDQQHNILNVQTQ